MLRHACIVFVGDGAKATVLETSIGQPARPHLSNHVELVAVGDGAEVTHIAARR